MSKFNYIVDTAALETPYTTNGSGQPVGFPLPDWSPCKRPDVAELRGESVYLRKLNPAEHLDELWEVFKDVPDTYFTFLYEGPFRTKDVYYKQLLAWEASEYYYFTIFNAATNTAVGVINLMRIEPQHGVIEVGCVCYSPKMQRSKMGTEVLFLLMKYVFTTLKYRRFEWKCDSHNIPSRDAAIRYGFQYEGMFRKAIVYRGRQRDTCWFSMLHDEFEGYLQQAYTNYLSADNYTPEHVQLKALQECIQPLKALYECKTTETEVQQVLTIE